MVRTYSLKKDGEIRLSDHFRVREFACGGTDEIQVDEELVERLEALRERLDCSKIVITSGYRADGSTSQHCRGKAADINCWHETPTGEERYQGREILLAAEDVGFRGIGWIPGNEKSRAAVHVDTRESAYRFDEANGNRMVKDNSWYAYFGLDKPEEATENPYAEPSALLRRGNSGDGVRWVQWELARLGYAVGGKGIDGVFGTQTDASVRAVQKNAGIQVDGIVGPDTRQALKVSEKPDKSRTYTVAAGDSLSRIGARMGVPWREIAQANNLQSPWVIHPGQVLVIPEV